MARDEIKKSEIKKSEIMALTGRGLDAAVLVEFHGWAWMQKIDDKEPCGLGRWALMPPRGSAWGRFNWLDSEWRTATGDEVRPEDCQLFTDWDRQGILREGEKHPVIGMPHPTEDANDVRDMEAEIGRRGLRGHYVKQIWGLLGGNPNDPDVFFRPVEVWDFMTAPLETKCRAALLAVLFQS